MRFGWSTTRPMLAVRFVLELVSLVAFGVAAWRLAAGWPHYLTAIAAPLAVASAWGVFAVPGDPTRSGETVVPTPGPARLLLELVVFIGAAIVLYATGFRGAGVVVGQVMLGYQILAADRIGWLLRGGREEIR